MAIDFTEKLGPLPVWGWGLIGGGVVIVGAYVLNRGGSDGGSVVKSAQLDSNGYQTSGINGGSASIPKTDTFDNNVLWLTRATAQTAARMSKAPTVVYAALKKYITGQEISSDEQEIVDVALGSVGLPPEGTQGLSPVTPKPTTPVQMETKFFYVPVNNAWGLIFGDGRQVTTTDQATANRWALEFGNAKVVKDNSEYGDYLNQVKSSQGGK